MARTSCSDSGLDRSTPLTSAPQAGDNGFTSILDVTSIVSCMGALPPRPSIGFTPADLMEDETPPARGHKKTTAPTAGNRHAQSDCTFPRLARGRDASRLGRKLSVAHDQHYRAL